MSLLGLIQALGFLLANKSPQTESKLTIRLPTDSQKASNEKVLHNLIHNQMRPVWHSTPPYGVNIKPDEQVIYKFSPAYYHQQRSQSVRVTDSAGMYGRGFRTGRSVSHSIPHDTYVYRGVGTLMITNQNIYFIGDTEQDGSARIPFGKLLAVSVIGKDDQSVSVVLDGVNPTRRNFAIGDGAFAARLISYLQTNGEQYFEFSFPDGPQSGKVGWFDLSKGYGGIFPDDNSDCVILSAESLEKSGLDIPTEGDRLSYKVIIDTDFYGGCVLVAEDVHSIT